MLERTDSDDVDGVRINIPLHHIKSQTYRVHAAAVPVLTLTLDASSTPDTTAAHQTVELATFKFSEECVTNLDTLVHDARKRAHDGHQSFVDQAVVVDFGIAADVPVLPKGEANHAEERTKEQIVCDVLAIDHGPDVWGMYAF